MPSPIAMLTALTGAVAIVLSASWDARADDVQTQRMDSHMEVTVRATPEAGDQARADAIVVAARRVMAQYPTVDAGEAAGYAKFLPSVMLPIEHFTNDSYAAQAAFGDFDPMHPTSLIFKRNGQNLTLVGVMYTSKRDAGAAELNSRVPLSIGTWHRHVAFCAGPPGTPGSGYFGATAKFGLLGSIATKDACDAAGGTFKPIIFGWMIHVWPNEVDRAKIWAVDPDGSMSRKPGMDNGASMNGM
ncbi:MAG: hypothetical protein IAI50_09345 [Candidatus Eremiobacteraeota bacterium]|nr:hypothetical protein [Candidatus Eremiobacteraeota bacterium]